MLKTPVTPENAAKARKREENDFMGAGIAIGTGVGLAIGAAMDNTGVGLAIGCAIGICFGVSMSRRKKESRDDASQD